MAYGTFVYEVADGIATIRLNEPDRLNALTFETYAELERVFAAMASDAAVKVVVLTGTGKGFCSGGSVHEIIGRLIEMNAAEQHRFTRLTCDVVKNMRGLKKPIIAAVNGISAGAGAILALASDIRILSDRAKFAFLFTRVGLSAPARERVVLSRSPGNGVREVAVSAEPARALAATDCRPRRSGNMPAAAVRRLPLALETTGDYCRATRGT